MDDAGITVAAALEQAYLAMSPASASNTRIPTRLRNKLAYALHNTNVEIEVRHKDTEPPLIRPCPDANEFEDNEYGWQDQLVVTVNHNFALLPGPGRFLAKPTPQRDANSTSTRDAVAARVRRENGIFVYPMSATVRLNMSVSSADVSLDLFDCSVCRAFGTKTEARFAEVRIEDRR